MIGLWGYTPEWIDDYEELIRAFDQVNDARRKAGMSPLTEDEKRGLLTKMDEERHGNWFAKDYSKKHKEMAPIKDWASSKLESMLPDVRRKPIVGLAKEAGEAAGSLLGDLIKPGGIAAAAGLAGLEALRRRKNDVVRRAATEAAQQARLEGDEPDGIAKKIKETVSKGIETVSNSKGAKAAGKAADWTMDKVGKVLDLEETVGGVVEKGVERIGGGKIAQKVASAPFMTMAAATNPLLSAVAELIPTPYIRRVNTGERDEYGNLMEPKWGVGFDPGIIGSYYQSYTDPNLSQIERDVKRDPFGVMPIGGMVGHMIYAPTVREGIKRGVQDINQTYSKNYEYQMLRAEQDDQRGSMYGSLATLATGSLLDYLADQDHRDELNNFEFNEWLRQGSPELPAIGKQE